MTQIIKISFITFITLFFLNSCVLKEGTIKNPCQNEEFTKDLASYSKSDLAKLARILQSSSYPSTNLDGCRAALLAKVYLAQNLLTKASEYFAIAARKLPELRDYFLLAKAKTESKNLNFHQAHQIANALLDSQTANLTPMFALRVRSVLADIAVAKKDDQQIIKTHQELLAKGYGESETLLFNLASALVSVGEITKANEIFKRLLINFPVSENALKAEQLSDLAQYNLDLKETEKRFDKLIEKLAFDQVVRDADFMLKRPNNSFETKGHLNSLAVKSLMLNNRFEAGIKRARQMVARSKTPKELESYAWALSKAGRYLEASDVYGQYSEVAKEREDKAKGCFFRGFSLYEASLYAMALFSWQTCNEIIQKTSYFENYLWYQALASMLSNNHQKAANLLLDLKKQFPKSVDNDKYSYFSGYNLRFANKEKEGNALLFELGNKKQPNYYVLLARQTLGLREAKGTAIAHDAFKPSKNGSKNTSVRNAVTLFHLGFRDEARDHVLSSSALFSDKLAVLQQMGFYHDVWRRSHVLKPTAEIARNSLMASPAIRSSHPMPHRPLVDTISKKYGVKNSLLYAIIQAESGFLENAQSYRGAMGLMQMMPFVAEDLAAHLPIDRWDSEHLKNPKISIELGALLVAILQRQFSDPHLVLAAYNAGPHQVQKWLDRFGELPPEIFIERIPFKQTREYIKKILPNESLYHAMTGQNLRLNL